MKKIQSLWAASEYTTKFVILFLALIISFQDICFAQQNMIVTERNLRDAILNRRVFTDQELLQLDLNGDGAVDVADLERFFQSQVPTIWYVGTMRFDASSVLPPQKVVVKLVPDGTGAQGSYLAEFQVDGSPFFSGPFSMSATATTPLGINFTSSGSGTLLATDPRNPFGRDVSWTLTISTVVPDPNGNFLEAAFSMDYSGVKTGQTVQQPGTMLLSVQQGDAPLVFEDVANLQTLYGL